MRRLPTLLLCALAACLSLPAAAGATDVSLNGTNLVVQDRDPYANDLLVSLVDGGARYRVEERTDGIATVEPQAGCVAGPTSRVALCDRTASDPATATVTLGESGSPAPLQQVTIDPASPIATRFSGSSGPDVFNGGPAGDVAFGFAGDDTLRGGGNPLTVPDQLYGSAGNDTVDGQNGIDRLTGGEGADVIKDSGTDGAGDVAEYLTARGQNDAIFRVHGVTVTIGDGRNDGGPEDSQTPAADDVVPRDDVQAGVENVAGTELNDVLVGDGAANGLSGFGGDDRLTGGGGADRMTGHAGNDTLMARDGAADTTIDCNNSDASRGTQPNSAVIDGALEAATDCADVDMGGSGGSGGGGGADQPKTPAGPEGPAGGTTTGGNGARPPAEAVIVPGGASACPAAFRLDLRSEVDADLLAAGRLGLEVDVPVAGITVSAMIADPDVLSAGRAVEARTSTGPGTMRVPLKGTTDLGRRSATRVQMLTRVSAPGCPSLYDSDDFEVARSIDGRLETAATARTAGVRARAARLVRRPPNPFFAERGATEIDCGPNNERVPRSDDPTFPANRHVIVADQAGLVSYRGFWICASYGEPPRCEERLDVPGVSSAVLTAQCLTRQSDGTYTSEGWIQLNGIRFTPRGGKITVDPARAKLTFSGSTQVATPEVRDGRLTGGVVVLHDGPLKEPIVVGREMSLLGGERSVGGKLVGFKLVTDVTAKLGTVPGGAQLALRVELPETWEGVQGRVTVDVTPQGADVRSANVFVPKLEYKGFTVSDLRLRYLLRPKDGKPVFIFEKAIVEIPVSPQAKRLGGVKVEVSEIVFADGRIEKFDINAGLDFKLKIAKLARLVSIKSLRATMDLQRKPGVLKGSAAVTLGPSIGDLDLIRLEGEMGFDFTAVPEYFIRNARLVTLGTEEYGGTFTFRPDGWTTFGGAGRFTAGFAQFAGRLRGQFIPDVGFEAYGRGVWSMYGYQLARSDVKFRQQYAAGCGYLNPVRMTVGVLVKYEQPIKAIPMQGCGFGEWNETGGRPGETNPGQRETRARIAATVRSFDVPAGLPKAAFSVVGAGPAAPRIVLVAPDGRRITAPTIADGVFAQVVGNEVVVAVNRPASGRWSIETLDGSPPVGDVRYARGMEPPEITAKVTRPGVFLERVLEVDVDAPKGTEVTFYEEPVDEDNGAAPAAIGKAGPGTKRLRFDPADGQGGLREIVASVEQDGMPLGASEVVARYRFGDPPVPTAPCLRPKGNFLKPSLITIGAVGAPDDDCSVRVDRDGDELDIAWKQSKGAVAHRVTVRVTDGRRDVFFVGPRTTRLTYRDVAADDGARISVVGVNELDEEGRAARGVIRGPDVRVRKPLRRIPAADDVGSGTVYVR